MMALDIVAKHEVPGVMKKIKKTVGYTRRKNTQLNKELKALMHELNWVSNKAYELLDENVAMKGRLDDARDAEAYAEGKVTKLKERIYEMEEHFKNAT